MSGKDCTTRGAPAVNPPEAYDWQLQGSIVTPVKAQKCGDCYAFSATANIESQYAKKYGKLVDLSEQQMLDCTTVKDSCSGGSMLHAIQ
ncbi:cathepsin L-like [Hyposmocoma kahamanoa]|uniref:cathepsin L-like n=1 Tax=Hyposmocoma kahamanoa TaxID=1477025 RepID=UPI000E6D6ED4|nr:cathepsin L-like [Hyposmocoma kahamanoa]